MIAAMTTNELQPGAANAIRVCLNVQPNERVTVISDVACREIGEALIKEIEAVGASYAAFVLEDEAPRPLTALPGRIAEDMQGAERSVNIACPRTPFGFSDRVTMSRVRFATHGCRRMVPE